MTDAQRIWTICEQCARTVHGATPPTPEYANRATRLLFGTAAQESGLVWERQRTPRWDGDVGGFSKWQLEKASITDSLEYLRRKPEVCVRATKFLFNDTHAPTTWIDTMPLHAILWAMRMDDNDRIGALFARLHYFRVPEAIPAGLREQAAYWKQHYNTSAGKGTVQQYIDSYQRHSEQLRRMP